MKKTKKNLRRSVAFLLLLCMGLSRMQLVSVSGQNSPPALSVGISESVQGEKENLASPSDVESGIYQMVNAASYHPLNRADFEKRKTELSSPWEEEERASQDVLWYLEQREEGGYYIAVPDREGAYLSLQLPEKDEKASPSDADAWQASPSDASPSDAEEELFLEAGSSGLLQAGSFSLCIKEGIPATEVSSWDITEKEGKYYLSTQYQGVRLFLCENEEEKVELTAELEGMEGIPDSELWFLQPLDGMESYTAKDLSFILEDGAQYYIQNRASKKCLSLGAGGNLVQMNASSAFIQRWTARKSGKYWSFEMGYNEGYYLAVENGSAEIDARIYAKKLEEEQPEEGMLWQLYETEGGIVLRSKASKGSLVFTLDRRYIKYDSAVFYQAEYQAEDEEERQRAEWIFEKVEKPSGTAQAPVSGQEYYIRNEGSGKLISHGRDVILRQYPEWGMPNQRYRAEDLGNGYWCFEASHLKGYYMGIGATWPSTQFLGVTKLDDPRTDDKVQWRIEEQEDGSWMLLTKAGRGECAVVAENLKDNGAPISRYIVGKEFEKRDRWTFVKVEEDACSLKDGSVYYIKNPESNMTLTAYWDNAFGTVLAGSFGMKNQAWKAIDVGEGYWCFQETERGRYLARQHESYLLVEEREDYRTRENLHWKVIEKEDGSVVLVSKEGGGTLVASPDAEYLREGDWVRVRQYTDQKVARWKLEEVQAPERIMLEDGGRYRFENIGAGGYLAFNKDFVLGHQMNAQREGHSCIWIAHEGKGAYKGYWSFSPERREDVHLLPVFGNEHRDVHIGKHKNSDAKWWRALPAKDGGWVWVSKCSMESRVLLLRENKDDGKLFPIQGQRRSAAERRDEWRMSDIPEKKHKVSFYVGGELYEERMVQDGSIIGEAPVPQNKPGRIFKRWNHDMNKKIKKDIRIDAIFEKEKSMEEALEEMAAWYVDNVYTYQMHEDSEQKTRIANRNGGVVKAYERTGRGRGMYECELLEGFKMNKVGDDCSGFVLAVIYYQTKGGFETNLNDSDTGAMLGDKFKEKMEKWGFVALNPADMEISDLQPGDILVQRGHVEFYLSETSSFGWGSVKKEYPKNNKFGKSASNRYFTDEGHEEYELVYRKK